MNYYIVVFKNTNDAMSGEKKLKELNYTFRIMPTPTTITQSCGICIRIEEKDIVERIVNDEIIQFKGVYIKNSEGYSLLS